MMFCLMIVTLATLEPTKNPTNDDDLILSTYPTLLRTPDDDTMLSMTDRRPIRLGISIARLASLDWRTSLIFYQLPPPGNTID